MEDLIKREDAIEAIEDTDWYHINRNGDLVSGARSDGTALYKAGDVYKALKEVPSADRPSGEWIDAGTDLDGTHYYRCSHCGWEVDTDYPNCPYCTAKMKGADDE